MLSSVTARFVTSLLWTVGPKRFCVIQLQHCAGRVQLQLVKKMSSTDNSTEHLMFVYGTLKHGQPNNHHIEDQSIGKAEFICSGHTTNKYPLVIAGKYNIPYLLHIPGKGHHVHGEIYKVDLPKRDFMDDFESHPTYYERMQEEIIVHHPNNMKEGCVPSGHDKNHPRPDATNVDSERIDSKTGNSLPSTIKCWVYFMKNYKPDMAELEPMACYDSKGEHGKQYVERYMRTESAAESFLKSK